MDDRHRVDHARADAHWLRTKPLEGDRAGGFVRRLFSESIYD